MEKQNASSGEHLSPTIHTAALLGDAWSSRPRCRAGAVFGLPRYAPNRLRQGLAAPDLIHRALGQFAQRF
jgi:hypothetical protein